MGTGLAISNLPIGVDRLATAPRTPYALRQQYPSLFRPVTNLPDLHDELSCEHQTDIIDYRCLELNVSSLDVRPAMTTYAEASTTRTSWPEKGEFVSVYA